MELPYLCHFRAFIGVSIHDSETEIELYGSDTWTNGFILGKKRQPVDPKKILNRFTAVDNPAYKFEKVLRRMDYGREIMEMESDLFSSYVKTNISDAKDGSYYELTGTIHERTSCDYWGEYDSENYADTIKHQEIDFDELQRFLRLNEEPDPTPLTILKV